MIKVLICYCCRKVHTESAKKWLERLQVENVPVLVCLTFADKLYAELMTEDGQHPLKESVRYELAEQLSVSVSKIATYFPCKCKCFSPPFLLCIGNPREAQLLPLPYDQVLLIQPGP